MANDETKKRLDYLCEQWGPALQAMATNDETRAAALAKRLLSLELGEGITQENICAGQELARAYLAQRAELDRLRAEVAATREAEAGAKFAGTSLVDWLRSEADRQDRITDELLTGELPDGQRNCRVPFQQFFAMAYRKIAELIENTASPDLLAEVRRLRKENAELEAWERVALSVMNELDTQAVGKLLGVPLGQPIYAAIEPGIRRLMEENAELAGAINAPLWLVWSNEHRAWWGPNGCNYYWSIESAGRYTLAEAQKICGTRGVERGHGINPPELVQPSPELIAMWEAAIARHDAGKGGAAR